MRRYSWHFALGLAAVLGAALAGFASARGLLLLALATVVAALGAGVAFARRAGRARRAELITQGQLERLVAERTAAVEAQRAELAEHVARLDAARAHLAVTDRLAAVGRLAAGVAHEVNNPLAVALTNLSWVLEVLRAEGDRGPGFAAVLAAITESEQAAQRVAEIVRDLQSFARDRSDGPGVADLARVVQHVRRLVGNEVRARARLAVDLPDGPMMVAGTPGRLGQLVTHLVVHGAHSIEEGHAADQEVRVSLRRDGAGWVELAVRDTGRGLAPDALAHVFDPFYEAWSSGHAQGLGLALCHGLVGALGGEIAVDSAPGRGSTCRVKLREAASATRLALRPTAGVASARPRVLVVDDEPLVVASLYRVLSHRFDVVPHTSPRHALALMHAGERFDAILCDLMMPELSGMAFFEEVARVSPAFAASIVFLTGGAFTEAAQKFLERVPNPFVAKPYDAAALVAFLLERCGALQPAVARSP